MTGGAPDCELPTEGGTEVATSRRVLAVAAAAALFVAACGGDDDDASDSAPTVTGDASGSGETAGDTATGSAATSGDASSDTAGDASSDTVASGDSGSSTASAGTGGVSGEALEELIAAAQAEGEVLAYANSPEQTTQPLYDAFQQKYGIKVSTVPRLLGPELNQRYESERAAGGSPADILNATDPAFYARGVEEGYIADLTVDDLPHLAEWPSDLVLPGNVWAALFTTGACYNTSTLTEADVSGYEALLDPDIEVLLVDPTGGDAALAPWAVIRDEIGPDFLTQFAARDGVTVSASASPATQLMVAGEGDLVFPCFEAFSVGLAAQGAPVDYALFDPVVVGGNSWGIPTDAPHPNAARLLLDFMLTEEGQAALTPNMLASPLGVEGSLKYPDEGFVKMDDPFTFALQSDKAELLELLGIES